MVIGYCTRFKVSSSIQLKSRPFNYAKALRSCYILHMLFLRSLRYKSVFFNVGLLHLFRAGVLDGT